MVFISLVIRSMEMCDYVCVVLYFVFVLYSEKLGFF